ncbi:MAG: acyl-CoA thioesterase [Cryobacterium sp.]|nr:acyl-CoA thioesterase [Oligoflexia bacterium]
MENLYRTHIEVRGYELDSFGHVNHANYLNYLEFARWKMLEEEGVTIEVFRKWDRFPVIAAIEIQYLKPTFMGDTLTVETRLVDYKRSSMHLEQNILKGDVKVTTAKIRSVIVSGEGRPAELPEELGKKWRRLLGRE